MTTGSRGLDGAVDALKDMLGDKPTSPVLGCCSWSRGKVNVGKATQPVPTVPPVLAESSHHPWRRHRTRRSVPMGMIPGEVAGHSLRAGLATSAAAAGVPERVIADQTGHKGTAMLRRYIREGSLFRENAASAVGL